LWKFYHEVRTLFGHFLGGVDGNGGDMIQRPSEDDHKPLLPALSSEPSTLVEDITFANRLPRFNAIRGGIDKIIICQLITKHRIQQE